MKDWLPELLRDPQDGSPLRLDAGSLVSLSRRRYPIVRGVPRFVPSEEYAGTFGFQWSRFSRTQLDSANGTTRSRDTFLEKTGLALDELRGKTVLDVGCGMGRFAEIVAEAGARVVAVDLSSSVDAAAGNLRRFETAAVVQADVFALPFARECFDVIYSIGVLHHTPDTRAAFLKLPPHLKPGGQIAVWLYSSELQRTLRMSRLYRLVTTRLPRSWLLQICRVAGPLGALQRHGKLGVALQRIVPISIDADRRWRILDTFDWYSPKYQWTHTDGEVDGWFREAGLKDIWHGPFQVSLRGAKA